MLAQKLRSHLIHSHQQKASNWKPIVTEMQLHPTLQTYDDIRPLPDGSLLFAYLPAPSPWISVRSMSLLQNNKLGCSWSHLNAQHQLYNSDLSVTSIACHLQRWVQTTRGRWWTVCMNTVATSVEQAAASAQQEACSVQVIVGNRGPLVSGPNGGG